MDNSDSQLGRRVLGIRQIITTAKEVGVPTDLALRLGDAIFSRFEDFRMAHRLPGNRHTPPSSPRRLMDWSAPGKDGVHRPLRRSCWSPVIRAVFQVPKDGYWYLIDETGGLSENQKRRCKAAATAWLRTAGWTGKDVRVLRVSAGIVARRS